MKLWIVISGMVFTVKAHRIVMMRRPATKFMKEPATRMISRFHQAALLKALGLSLSSSSPSMAQ